MSLQGYVNTLGLKAEDKVTGFKGVTEAVNFDLYGCVQVLLRGPVNDKGELPDGRWFDFHRMVFAAERKRVMPVPSFVGLQPEAQRTDFKGPADKPAAR